MDRIGNGTEASWRICLGTKIKLKPIGVVSFSLRNNAALAVMCLVVPINDESLIPRGRAGNEELGAR